MTDRASKKFEAALKTVVRGLGGQRQVLLALDYLPHPTHKGYWLPSNGNRYICFKQKDAIARAFQKVEWFDRARMAEKIRPKP